MGEKNNSLLPAANCFSSRHFYSAACDRSHDREGNLSLRYRSGARILRILHLLCENRCSAWQTELGSQNPVVPSDVDVVSHVSKLFGTFATYCRKRTPSAAAMKGMADDDPQMLIIEDSFTLLGQFADTISEFTIGPHRGNQSVILAAETSDGQPVLEACPVLLHWLAQRQKNLLFQTEIQTTKYRQRMRRKRMRALMRAELSTLRLCAAVLEGSLFADTDRMLRLLRRHPAGVSLSNTSEPSNLQLLSYNLQLHGEFSRTLTEESSVETSLLNHDINCQYFVLMERLQTHDSTVRPTFTAADADPSQFKEEYKKVGKTIRQVTIKVAGQPPHQTYQELYFQLPPSCLLQEKRPLLDKFFVSYFFDVDEYLDQPWSQRHISMMGQMGKYKEVHDHQMYMDNNPIIHVFQLLGRLTDLWTLVQTIGMNLLLMYGYSHPLEEASHLEWVETALRVGAQTHVITSSIKTVYFFSQMPFVFTRIAYREKKGDKTGCGCVRLLTVMPVLFGGVENVYMILYLILSWLGLVWNYFFFAFHLLEFFFVTDIARLLLDVVVSRTRQLLVTMFLGFILTYLFAAIGWKLVVPHFEYGFEGSLVDWNDHWKSPSFSTWVFAHWSAGIRDGPIESEFATATACYASCTCNECSRVAFCMLKLVRSCNRS